VKSPSKNQAKNKKARKLRNALSKMGTPTITAFAAQIGCSRPAIYFALERPDRFPKVTQKILEVLNATQSV
jgi:hypothetical protein